MNKNTAPPWRSDDSCRWWGKATMLSHHSLQQGMEWGYQFSLLSALRLLLPCTWLVLPSPNTIWLCLPWIRGQMVNHSVLSANMIPRPVCTIIAPLAWDFLLQLAKRREVGCRELNKQIKGKIEMKILSFFKISCHAFICWEASDTMLRKSRVWPHPYSQTMKQQRERP